DGWKKYWRYSGGDMADCGVHQLDLARFLIDKPFPKSVSGVAGNFVFDDDREVPDTQSLVYEYDDLVMTFELTQWAPYMRKTPGEIRRTDSFPQWDVNANARYDKVNFELRDPGEQRYMRATFGNAHVTEKCSWISIESR
ncbi:MAG: hypothetical protein IH941_05325, partial [Acidobacteria bacterium]|nr:hypothetical protein [Acidobacteriota bacterium]